MPVEVPHHVEEILGGHPELLEQWKTLMGRPCMREPEYAGSVEQYLDPLYLRTVVVEHRRLIEGKIEQPGPELAAAIEKALDIHPPVREKRARDLADPWWRADSYHWNGIAEYYDPDFLRRRAEACKRLDDPFSPESINLRRFVEEPQAGGTWEVTENATGKVVDRFTTDGSPEGAAGRN